MNGNQNEIEEVASLEKTVFTHPWTYEMILASVESEYDRVKTITVEGRLIGYVIYSVVCDSTDLLRVAVDPDERRHGVGAELLEFMLKDCADRAVENIFLEVRESNFPAISLYKKYGFVEISRRKKYYTSPVEDGIVMQKKLK